MRADIERLLTELEFATEGRFSRDMFKQCILPSKLIRITLIEEGKETILFQGAIPK